VTDLTDAEHLQFILDLLAISCDAELVYEECPFLWHVADGRASFSMACSDTFYWGCADAETIAPADISLLRDCVAELRSAGPCEEMWLGVYFCARKRGMRPMNRWMKDMREKEGMPEAVEALFCTAGPERESDETGDDLVRDVTEVLTSMCARLYGRRSAKNRAARGVAAAMSEY
jgi:hypothetical protein